METVALKVYSAEEIEMFLKGDRREVDRLMIHSLNNLASVMIPHMAQEDDVFKALGDPDVIRSRSAWIEAQIKKQEKRNRMMDKVTESTLLWALPLFVLILFVWFGDSILDAARHALAKRAS